MRTKSSFPTRERGLKFLLGEVNEKRIWSFPTRERGLKSLLISDTAAARHVVPHEGTWIEITITGFAVSTVMSFPTRERGLKSCCQIDTDCLELSFPTRERGLKFQKRKKLLPSKKSFPTRERGLKWICFTATSQHRCRSPRGNVD